MTGVENQAFDDELLESSEHKSAVLGVPKDGHYKITKSGKVKIPRRLLHCSDGIYEEYSTDEEEEEADIQPVVDPKSLTWGPYLWYWTSTAAFKGLSVCDFLGEKLAWFFGITSPRFQYALDEVERMQREQSEHEEQEKEEREAELEMVKTTKPPKPVTYGATEFETATLSVSEVNVTENDEKGDH